MSTIGSIFRTFIPLRRLRAKEEQGPMTIAPVGDLYRQGLPGEFSPEGFSDVERDLTLLGLKDSLAQARLFLGSAPTLRPYPLYGLLELMVASTLKFPNILQSWDGVPLEGGGRVSLHVQKKLFDLRVPSTLTPALTGALKRCALNIAEAGTEAAQWLPFHGVDLHQPFKDWRKDVICEALRSLQVTNVNMVGVDLSGGDLAGVRFFGQYHETNFMAANLKGALLSSGFKANNFSHCDLRQAVLSGYFERCNFKGAKVNTLTLKQARTELIGAVLTP